MARILVFYAIVAIFMASQLFWVRRIREWGRQWISSSIWRRRLSVGLVALYLFLLAYNFLWSERVPEPARLTLRAAFFEAPFRWWFFSSLLGFLVAVVLSAADRLARLGYGVYAKLFLPANPGVPALLSPDRRRFLEQSAYAVCTAPFVAGAYGLLYERLNLEVTRQRIQLRRLPRAFHGLRITQLSDVHIGPFMPAQEIQRYVAITNQAKPDLVVLTGDFVTWDAPPQEAVVAALAGLKAPLGILGCLGNHELWTHTEDSITRLFAAAGIKILRQARAPVVLQGESLNLIGMDFQTRTRMGPAGQGIVRQYLEGVEPLLMPGTANILLSHNPNTFDRATALGIDLSLAGHTHGGQVTLEFIHPDLSPSRLITPYVKGLFQQGDSQLYVNRGIGTIGVPIRLGAPPEITVFELVRA